MLSCPYYYLKSYEKKSKFSKINSRKMLGGFFISSGVISFVFLVVVPLASSILFNNNNTPIVKAVGKDFDSNPGNLTALDLIKNHSDKNKILGLMDSRKIQKDENRLEEFFLSIPKLGIKDALVEANSTNLDPSNSLVHILGTQEPGSSGNVFVTGHSTFKYLFAATDYKSIFSTIDELKEGDKIIVKAQGEEYVYKVIQQQTLKPEDVSMYEQYFPNFLNKQTITLMTCWPGGTTKYRLLITGELEE